MELGSRDAGTPRASGAAPGPSAALTTGSRSGEGEFRGPHDTSPAFLVVGEALIDVLAHPNGGAERVPGGSPANVALGLARLGIRSEFLSHLTTDADGMRILARLADSGVTVLPASLGARRTPTAEVTLDAAGQAGYSFFVTWELPPVDAIPLPAALHIGSYSAFAAPGADRVLRLAERARREGRLVTLDPNIRPALIGSQHDVRARFEQLARLSHVVKLSDEDAAWLFPGARPDDALGLLLGLGVELAAVTRGSAGSQLATAAARATVAAPETRVVDTIGAGDSYMAALAAAALRVGGNRAADGDLARLPGETLKRIGRACAAAAAVTVSRRGADLPTRNELVVAEARD